MEISSYLQEDEGRFAARTLSDISIASNASGKAQNLSSFGAPKHVRDTRVKFLCSHGGKILPRPSDKRLRYVGGETRMISVPRHIQLTALKLKLAEVYGHDVTFKYQLPEEDLDALVSVSSDEDLDNMMEECDRLDAMEGSCRLRVFVFSSVDHDAIDFNDVADPKTSEHRYVEAVNTIQVDVSSCRQNDNVFSPDFYKSASGPSPNYVWNTAVMQERLLLPSENLHPQAYPLEQLTPVGNYPPPTLPQRNNLLGHVAPPPRIAVTKQRNEIASSLHANNVSSHGPLATVDDFFDLESGESASSSASSQHDLHHRSRWNSNSQIQSHLEQIAYRIDEDQMLRSDTRGQHESLIDSKLHTTYAAPFPPSPEHMYSLNTNMEDKIAVHEDQPLSPGALLQKQLQADQNHLETDSTRTYQKQGSQSSLDGNTMQPTESFLLSHERQKIEQFPLDHPATAIIQEGVLAGGHLLSETLNVPGKVHPLPEGTCIPLFPNSDASAPAVQLEVAEKAAVFQTVKPQEASLYPTVFSHVEYIQSPYNNDDGDLKLVSGLVHQPFVESPSLSRLQTITTDINERYELDGLNQHVLPSSTTVCTEQSHMNGFDFGIQSQAAWLPENLVSFPPRENPQVDVLDQIMDQSKVMNASGVTANQFVVAGHSLLEEPICYNEKLSSAAMPDVKVELASAAIRECSPIDMMSDILPSAPLINCCSSSMDTLVATLLNPLAKPNRDEISLSIVTDVTSGLSLDKASDAVSELSLNRVSDHMGFHLSHGTESTKQPVYQGNVVCFDIDDEKTKLYKKGNFDLMVEKEGADAKQSSFTLQREAQNIVGGQLEHEQMTHVNYEKDAVQIESSMVMERDLTIESSRLETEEEDVFSSSVDMPMNAAAIAETEAIARGLQTIRNFDLEELKELGSGTFGTVYHGKWRGTDVAIKRIKSSCFAGRPSERERLMADFWQEAYILGQLHHPNVVAFYGVVPDGPDGTLATVTEYMVNGSLKQALQRKERTLDRRKRLIIAMDAAFGMEYLHKKNVVHFDLKCENLLVNLRDIQRPICKVGDLGLSKVKQQTMISGGVRGTLPWMAPELLNGSSSLVSEKVDVFSFGIVLWELLTGEEPYASMHYGAIIGGIVTNTLRPPVPRWCDGAWRSLMEACWAAEPAERPTFTEIANNLRIMEANLNAKAQGPAQNVE